MSTASKKAQGRMPVIATALLWGLAGSAVVIVFVSLYAVMSKRYSDNIPDPKT